MGHHHLWKNAGGIAQAILGRHLHRYKGPWLHDSSGTRSFSEALAVSPVAGAGVEEPAALSDLPVPDAKQSEVIWAVPRAASGKSIAGRERRAGRVPAIVASVENGQSGGNKRLISVDTNQISRLLRRFGRSFFLSRTFDLEVHPSFDSEEIISNERVLPRWVHLHAGNDRILTVTFLRAPSHTKLRVEVPLVFRGEDACPGLRKGGFLNVIKRVVPYISPADHIPPYIDIDLSNLDVGGKVLMKDLKVHPSAKLNFKDPSMPVCKIMGTRSTD